MPTVEARGWSWLVGKPWFWALGVTMLFALPLGRALTSPPPKFPPVLGTFPAFDGSASVAGKVWVAAAFGADRPTPATTRMRELERHMRKLGDTFHLVSLSTDPPARLDAWAAEEKINRRRWSLVHVAPETLDRLLAAVPAAARDTTLVLVDAHGRMRGRYDTDKDDALETLIYEAALLVNDY
jgi:hypothetical protein